MTLLQRQTTASTTIVGTWLLPNRKDLQGHDKLRWPAHSGAYHRILHNNLQSATVWSPDQFFEVYEAGAGEEEEDDDINEALNMAALEALAHSRCGLFMHHVFSGGRERGEPSRCRNTRRSGSKILIRLRCFRIMGFFSLTCQIQQPAQPARKRAGALKVQPRNCGMSICTLPRSPCLRKTIRVLRSLSFRRGEAAWHPLKLGRLSA